MTMAAKEYLRRSHKTGAGVAADLTKRTCGAYAGRGDHDRAGQYKQDRDRDAFCNRLRTENIRKGFES